MRVAACLAGLTISGTCFVSYPIGVKMKINASAENKIWRYLLILCLIVS